MKMNVLHINENCQVTGGTEVYIYQLQELLPQHGVGSFFIAISNSMQRGKFDIKGQDISHENLSLEQLKVFLQNYVVSRKIDLIHIHSFENPRIIRFCFELCPVIKSVHNPWMFCPGRQKFFVTSETICTKPFGLHCCIHAFTQKCQDSRRPSEIIRSYSNVKFETAIASRKYKHILAMSDYIMNEAVLTGIPSDKITVNPYFTPDAGISKVEVLGKGLKRIVFAGRLHPSKGIHVLIRSLRDILKNTADVVLDIIGDGSFKNELLKLINNELIPSDKIIFHGWLKHEEIIQKIKESYLVVFPSIYPESFGIVGIEAMMCAKPVVAFNVGGVSTWLHNEVTGFLVENKNEKQFAKKVKELLDQKEVHDAFCENARGYYLKKFTPEIHMNKLIKIYSESLN